ncbi:MAG: flagellar biosynthetic protein FliO [Syntrophorhabdales bacterium]|jgi:flagellar biogenesis protein FliO
MENIYFSAVKMLFVLAAMVSAALVLHRLIGKGRLNLGSGNRRYGLQKVETIQLGYRKFVSVIEVRNRVLVLGVGEKEMALLAEWKKEEKDAS